MKTTAGESTIGVNHVRSLLVVCLPALLLCHELQSGMACQARLGEVCRRSFATVAQDGQGLVFIPWLLGTLCARWKVHQLPTLRVWNGRLSDVLSPERSWLVDGRQEGLWANQQQKEKMVRWREEYESRFRSELLQKFHSPYYSYRATITNSETIEIHTMVNNQV